MRPVPRDEGRALFSQSFSQSLSSFRDSYYLALLLLPTCPYLNGHRVFCHPVLKLYDLANVVPGHALYGLKELYALLLKWSASGIVPMHIVCVMLKQSAPNVPAGDLVMGCPLPKSSRTAQHLFRRPGKMFRANGVAHYCCSRRANLGAASMAAMCSIAYLLSHLASKRSSSRDLP